MDMTDYFVLVVGLAVVAIVIYGGYHRAIQNHQQTRCNTETGRITSGVPAE